MLHLGSERCCEALQKLNKHYDIVVNIQGDEPLIEPELPPTPLQLEEDLEQLKVLENGYRMKVSQIEIVFVIAMLFCYDSWKN
jgi:CMP-2-keto-3-deoxyoctulosonic acid synthetase